MTVRPEPNADALAQTLNEVLEKLREHGHVDDGYCLACDFEPDAALTELAALARANTAQERLLHDAMDALEGADPRGSAEWHDNVDDLLGRFRALTGADAQESA